jgi:hypothetical protein
MVARNRQEINDPRRQSLKLACKVREYVGEPHDDTAFEACMPSDYRA